jgi:hypothetical protein
MAVAHHIPNCTACYRIDSVDTDKSTAREADTAVGLVRQKVAVAVAPLRFAKRVAVWIARWLVVRWEAAVFLANPSCRRDQARSEFRTRPVVGKNHRIPVSFSLARYHNKSMYSGVSLTRCPSGYPYSACPNVPT